MTRLACRGVGRRLNPTLGKKGPCPHPTLDPTLDPNPRRRAGAGLLAVNYVGAIGAALRLPGAFRGRLMVPAHLALAGVLAAETARFDRSGHTPGAVAAFYRGIWNLFYAGAPSAASMHGC